MTTGERLTLDGCAPTPLASYLKALGVLRLLSSGASNVTGEPADPGVRGWWEGERFHLRTTLGREGVTEFFLHGYAPSPVIAPWNGGSGFYAKDNRDGFAPLSAETVATRFKPFSAAIRVAVDTLADLEMTTRPGGAEKADLVALLRSRLADSALPWVDAALVLSGGRLSFPQLLGTGGNDGRLDFTNNLMRRLVSPRKAPGIFDASSGEPRGDAPAKLEHALWGTPVHDLRKGAVGQFAPGDAGGPNATTGYEGSPAANSWDLHLHAGGRRDFRKRGDAPPSEHRHRPGQLSVHRRRVRGWMGWNRSRRRNGRTGRVLGPALDKADPLPRDRGAVWGGTCRDQRSHCERRT